jgi:hypothetical protein
MGKQNPMTITFDTGPRKGWVAPKASATIYYAPEDDHWIANLEYQFWCGDHRGCAGPMHGNWPDGNSAIMHHMNQLLAMLQHMDKADPNGVGCFNANQQGVARELLTQVEQYLGLEDHTGQQDLFAMA